MGNVRTRFTSIYLYLDIHWYCHFRARRALTLFMNHVLLRIRRVLLLYKFYGDSALLVLNGTPFHSINALLVLSWQYLIFIIYMCHIMCNTWIIFVYCLMANKTYMAGILERRNFKPGLSLECKPTSFYGTPVCKIFIIHVKLWTVIII